MSVEDLRKISKATKSFFQTLPIFSIRINTMKHINRLLVLKEVELRPL